MQTPEYSLPVSDAPTLKCAQYWLLLGVLALGVAGVFAGVLANTKSAFFDTALVEHVDLSVLVWFLTVAAMLFTLASAGKGLPMVPEAAFYSFAAGTVCLVLASFTGAEPYKSNYIPVIHHPLFFLGLGLLLCGVSAAALNLLTGLKAETLKSSAQSGVASAAIIMLIAVGCFVWSARSVPAGMTGQIYYEYAFWGGGHVLQFAHTQLMLVCWLWLADAGGLTVRPGKRLAMALYVIGLLAAVAALFIYLSYDPMSDEHRGAFTHLMKHANGLPAVVAGVMLAFGLIKTPWNAENRLARVMLLSSLVIFAAGGALGYLIAGNTVTVPAHYHGSIVGVTLAFMGVAYLLLPAFGWKSVQHSKLALIQPVIYALGMLCWMAGMTILGAHGVPRKTAGSADTMGALAAFLKHGGDGLALIGGLLFVFVVLRAIYKNDA